MILYGCDFCDEVLKKGDPRYLIKVTRTGDVSNKSKSTIYMCLCKKCKKSWAEKVPQLFDFDDKEG